MSEGQRLHRTGMQIVVCWYLRYESHSGHLQPFLNDFFFIESLWLEIPLRLSPINATPIQWRFPCCRPSGSFTRRHRTRLVPQCVAISNKRRWAKWGMRKHGICRTPQAGNWSSDWKKPRSSSKALGLLSFLCFLLLLGVFTPLSRKGRTRLALSCVEVLPVLSLMLICTIQIAHYMNCFLRQFLRRWKDFTGIFSEMGRAGGVCR